MRGEGEMAPKHALGTLSISGCLRMKFNTESGSVAVSLWQVPGRGSGTLEFSTGSQALFEVACSLNLPVDG